jgi:hypothetical protein
VHGHRLPAPLIRLGVRLASREFRGYAVRMDDDGNDSDALDRAAILARRQRFIALALTGLAAACGDDGGPSPTPCLDVAPQTESSSVTGPTGGDTSVDQTGGQPCLGAIPETSSSDSSGTAESTTSTGTDEGESTGTGTSTGDSTSAGDGSSGSSTGMPLPCLAPKP